MSSKVSNLSKKAGKGNLAKQALRADSIQEQMALTLRQLENALTHIGPAQCTRLRLLPEDVNQ